MWREEMLKGLVVFRPAEVPPGLLVAFSGRGEAPAAEISPTAYLARRFTSLLGLPQLPIVRATQVHGVRAARIRGAPPAGEVVDAGECDVLATDAPGVGLIVQTADCVPIGLAGKRVVAAVHAGWRGSAQNAAASAIEALKELGEDPAAIRVWLGPSIGRCCYEVGGEVAARFAGDFLGPSRDGRFRLDLAAVNRAQLAAAGVRAENISAHSACTFCGGERFASFRRDGERAGRMIGLIARFARA